MKQPLLLNVKGVANRNDQRQVTNHWIVVTGFAPDTDSNGEKKMGPAEASGNIKVKREGGLGSEGGDEGVNSASTIHISHPLTLYSRPSTLSLHPL